MEDTTAYKLQGKEERQGGGEKHCLATITWSQREISIIKKYFALWLVGSFTMTHIIPPLVPGSMWPTLHIFDINNPLTNKFSQDNSNKNSNSCEFLLPN